MSTFFDAAYGIAIINLLNTIVNIYWTVKLKNIQGNGELLRNLTDQNKAKDQLIIDLNKEKHSLKMRYANLLKEYQKINQQLNKVANG